jgi:hypothetical protein
VKGWINIWRDKDTGEHIVWYAGDGPLYEVGRALSYYQALCIADQFVKQQEGTCSDDSAPWNSV